MCQNGRRRHVIDVRRHRAQDMGCDSTLYDVHLQHGITSEDQLLPFSPRSQLRSHDNDDAASISQRAEGAHQRVDASQKDLQHCNTHFNPGDRVWFGRSSIVEKLLKLYFRPHKALCQVGEVDYEVVSDEDYQPPC